MKLRNIFTALAAAAIAFVGCQVEERFLDEVQVSQSVVAFEVAGNSVDVTVNANDAWEIVGMPEWLTASPASGEAGEYVVTFTAQPSEETREAIFYINVGEVQQVMNALQMAEKVETPLSTCKDVINGVDGKVYKIKGTVTSIVNTQYGNWYIQDETGSVYVYGTLYNGATQQFTKLGLEVGDIVTIEGPRKDYNGTIEMIDVTVLSIEKSLLKLEKVTPVGPYAKEGDTFSVLLTNKGGDITVEASDEWITCDTENVLVAGTTVVYDFTLTANEAGARTGSVKFSTVVDEVEYFVTVDIEQLGAIAEVTVAEFLAEPVGTALYKLTGKVSGLKTGDYGNFHLVDATGSVYVYGLTATPVEKNDKSFPTLGIKEGDVVTLIGTRAQYANAKVEEEKEQVGGPAYYVSHISSTESTVADFLAQPVAADKWYRLTGKVANMKSDVYGNFDLVDETGSVYVYGLTVAPVAKNDKSFANTGVKEGDIVTLVGTRAAYNGAAQVGGPAYYISHEAGANPWDEAAVFVNGEDAADDALMKSIAAYADATNLYVRVTAVAALDGANYLDVSFCDGNGENAVWWGWTTTGTNTYWKEHKGAVDADGNLTAMQFSFNGEYKDIAVKSEKAGDDHVWTMTYPREYLAAYEANGKIYVSSLLWKDWGGYWAAPARGNAMLEVTLP